MRPLQGHISRAPILRQVNNRRMLRAAAPNERSHRAGAAVARTRTEAEIGSASRRASLGDAAKRLEDSDGACPSGAKILAMHSFGERAELKMPALRTPSPGGTGLRFRPGRRPHLPLRIAGAGVSDYAIKVIQKDGDEDYLCDGLGSTPSRFPSRAAAQRQVDFMEIGMEGDVQAIVIVKYPRKR